MKLLAGCIVSSGLFLAAWSAHAQVLAPDGAGRLPLRTVSDLEEPDAGVAPAPPPYAPSPYAPPGYGYGPPPYAPPAYGNAPQPYAPPAYAPPAYGYAPSLMPPHEVYAVLRENGFSPLGIPHRLGPVYEIAAMGPDGEDGRLIIDGRTERIIRFTPGYWGGRSDDSDLRTPYDAQDAMPPPTAVRGVPRPPALIPHVARRAVGQPAREPAVAAQPSEPVQRSAERPAFAPAQAQARTAAAAPATSARAGEVKPPASPTRPTEAMPPVQGLE